MILIMYPAGRVTIKEPVEGMRFALKTVNCREEFLPAVFEAFIKETEDKRPKLPGVVVLYCNNDSEFT
jgi:hypothetical protein